MFVNVQSFVCISGWVSIKLPSGFVNSGGKHALKKKSLFIAPMKRELLYGNKFYLDLKVPLKFF